MVEFMSDTLDSRWKALEGATSELNARVDAANKRVLEMEGKITEIAPGVEAWMKGAMFDVGYCKVAGKWKIAIRHDDMVWGYTEAPRMFRAQGFEMLESLPVALFQAVQELAQKFQEVGR